MERVRPCCTMVPDEAVAKNIELTIEAVNNAAPKDVIVECGT